MKINRKTKVLLRKYVAVSLIGVAAIVVVVIIDSVTPHLGHPNLTVVQVGFGGLVLAFLAGVLTAPVVNRWAERAKDTKVPPTTR